MLPCRFGAQHFCGCAESRRILNIVFRSAKRLCVLQNMLLSVLRFPVTTPERYLVRSF